MGDRCLLRVRTLRAHAPLFEAIGMLVEDEHEPNEVVMVDEQANFGLAADLERLAKRGVVFLADASAGEQYGPELTVSDGTGKAIAVAADFRVQHSRQVRRQRTPCPRRHRARAAVRRSPQAGRVDPRGQGATSARVPDVRRER